MVRSEGEPQTWEMRGSSETVRLGEKLRKNLEKRHLAKNLGEEEELGKKWCDRGGLMLF